MRLMQARYAVLLGSWAVTDCLPFDIIREEIVMVCNVVKYKRKRLDAWRGVAMPRYAARSPIDRIMAFLDGDTHGEELFHALYDHILDEPIPSRLRALFEN
jgi:hypothetical protein